MTGESLPVAHDDIMHGIIDLTDGLQDLASPSAAASVAPRCVTLPADIMPANVAAWSHIDGLDEKWQPTKSVAIIQWSLQAPFCSYEESVWHCLDILNNTMNKYRRWKWGHTHVPVRRLLRFQRSGREPPRLIFCYVATDLVLSGAMEIRLCRHLKDDRRQFNVRPGGEMVDLGPPPYFIHRAMYYR